MYDSNMLVDEINLLKAANEAKFTDLNTAHEFTRDGSGNNPAVSVVRQDDGSVVVITNKLSALPRATQTSSAQPVQTTGNSISGSASGSKTMRDSTEPLSVSRVAH